MRPCPDLFCGTRARFSGRRMAAMTVPLVKSRYCCCTVVSSASMRLAVGEMSILIDRALLICSMVNLADSPCVEVFTLRLSTSKTFFACRGVKPKAADRAVTISKPWILRFSTQSSHSQEE